MFRTVYWHHGVRAATALYKRIVEDSIEVGLIRPDELVGPVDEELLHELAHRAGQGEGTGAQRIAGRWIPALRSRRLPKRAVELTAADLEGVSLPGWVRGDSPRKRRTEDAIALDLGLEPGEAVIDFPDRGPMFRLDLLVERRSGEVLRLGRAGLPGVIDLPRVADELYRSARVLRLFTFESRTVSAEYLVERLFED